MEPIHYVRCERGDSFPLDPDSFQRVIAQDDYGLRVFTTFVASLTANTQIRIFGFEQHLSRLFQNGAALDIVQNRLPEHQPNWVRELVLSYLRQVLNRRGLAPSFIIRLVLGPHGIDFFVGPYQPPWQNSDRIQAVSIELERSSPELKTTTAKQSVDARRFAEQNNAAEALLVDRQGFVKEGAWSNLFWFDRNGNLYTPETRILPGITRQAVLQMERCVLTEISRPDFYNQAQEAFITQSTTGITPLLALDGKPIGSGRPGPWVSRLRDKFSKLVAAQSLTITAE